MHKPISFNRQRLLILLPIFLLHMGLLLLMREPVVYSEAKSMCYLPLLQLRPDAASPLSASAPEQATSLAVQRKTRGAIAPNSASDRPSVDQPPQHTRDPEHQDQKVSAQALGSARSSASSSALDLERIRQHFQQSEKTRQHDLMEQQQLAQITVTPEMKLQTELDKAHREDCMMARSEGMKFGNVTVKGLLIIAPVLVDTIKGKGCKW
ncbi:hypothetical protein ACO0K3_15155 [Undibacterium sp. Rencai35W]|uniref:hypothetical protein n=1 Tax=Undibacterium sp. Rencai35W TaxID=3413046 RepID=UPI003BF42D16